MEKFTASNGAPILHDVGHNPGGAWAVHSFLGGMEERQPSTLIVSCLRDKAISEMAEILLSIFNHIIFTHVDSPRAATVEELSIAAAASGETLRHSPMHMPLWHAHRS
jgi:dihydrofolate synthase/folylpolyglutamate synthase